MVLNLPHLRQNLIENTRPPIHDRGPNFDVSGTPTLFIVDSSGIVRKVYVGQLSAAHEKELIAYVKQSA